MVALDKNTAAWARKMAAERNMTLSRFIAEQLQGKMRQAREYERAMHRFFAGGLVALKGARERYPSREQLYQRGRLRLTGSR